MKKIIYTISILSVAALQLISCQQMTDVPVSNPTVSTGEVTADSIHTATINGATNASKCYFIVSTDPALTAPTTGVSSVSSQYDVTPSNGKVSVNLTGLKPNTKYYYCCFATDGLNSIKGDVKSFTTGKIVTVNSVKLVNWSEATASSDYTNSPLGMFYVNSSTLRDSLPFRNHQLSYNSTDKSWSMADEIIPTVKPYKIYAYSPFTKSYEFPKVFVTTNGDNTDFVCGLSADITKTNAGADITLRHRLAKLVFTVTRSADDNVGNTFTKSDLYTSWDYYMIPVSGFYNVLKDSFENVTSTHRVSQAVTPFVPDVKTATNIEYTIIPYDNHSTGLQFILYFDGGSLSVPIPAYTWKDGFVYTYPVIVSQQKLIIGDVSITPWTKDSEENVSINN